MNHFTEILHNTSRQIIAERMNAEQKSGGGSSLRSANPALFSYICTGLRNLISCVHSAVPCSEKSHRDIKEVCLWLMLSVLLAILFCREEPTKYRQRFAVSEKSHEPRWQHCLDSHTPIRLGNFSGFSPRLLAW